MPPFWPGINSTTLTLEELRSIPSSGGDDRRESEGKFSATETSRKPKILNF
jgi:hypothetical protein